MDFKKEIEKLYNIEIVNMTSLSGGWINEKYLINCLHGEKYVLKELSKTPEEAKDFARIEPETVKAFEVDLNDDGEKEIVGVVYSTFYLGTAGYSLFILQLQNGEYKNIAYVLSIEPQNELKILNAKTNGYRDIKLSGSVAYNFKPFIAKYKNGYYQNNDQTKSLERKLQQ